MDLIATLSIITLGMRIESHYAEYLYAGCRIFLIVMLIVVILSAIMLSVAIFLLLRRVSLC
jgi:hypothetical protein